MLELNVSNVPHATASDDGLTLTIIFDLEDGGQARMHIPYGQYDWWIQAMQVVASAAFRKQVEAGPSYGNSQSRQCHADSRQCADPRESKAPACAHASDRPGLRERTPCDGVGLVFAVACRVSRPEVCGSRRATQGREQPFISLRRCRGA
jgi:hypothetical protein